jgi:hypothetical protein
MVTVELNAVAANSVAGMAFEIRGLAAQVTDGAIVVATIRNEHWCDAAISFRAWQKIAHIM